MIWYYAGTIKQGNNLHRVQDTLYNCATVSNAADALKKVVKRKWGAEVFAVRIYRQFVDGRVKSTPSMTINHSLTEKSTVSFLPSPPVRVDKCESTKVTCVKEGEKFDPLIFGKEIEQGPQVFSRLKFKEEVAQ